MHLHQLHPASLHCIPTFKGQRDSTGCPTHSSSAEEHSKLQGWGKEGQTIGRMSSRRKRTKKESGLMRLLLGLTYKTQRQIPLVPARRYLPQHFTMGLCVPVAKVRGCRKVLGMVTDRLVGTETHRCSKSHSPAR